MKKITLAAMSAALIMMSSCSSTNQFYGAATGASLGGLFGSAIGGITGGHRGHDMGTVLGMAVGAAVGAAATAPKTQDGNYRSSDYNYDYDRDDYRQNNYYSPYADIVIEDLRFNDNNRNQHIDAGEHAKISFIIRNTGRDYVYDLAPVITVSGTKQIYLSPTAIVSELAPGRAVRYQAEVVATNKLKNGRADFSIGLSDGDHLYTMCSFQIQTRRR
ncbi:MAG: hypothetical protein J6S96_00420 [Muribaculaceae bacterium]|nr:hypothetical protein [Muribaculaceae bacterium]